MLEIGSTGSRQREREFTGERPCSQYSLLCPVPRSWQEQRRVTCHQDGVWVRGVELDTAINCPNAQELEAPFGLWLLVIPRKHQKAPPESDLARKSIKHGRASQVPEHLCLPAPRKRVSVLDQRRRQARSAAPPLAAAAVRRGRCGLRFA